MTAGVQAAIPGGLLAVGSRFSAWFVVCGTPGLALACRHSATSSAAAQR